MDAIAQAVNVAIGGTTEGQFTSSGHRYDIDLRLEGLERGQPQDIQKLDVRNQYGELVPLSEVTRIELHPTLQTVARIDRQRAISVNGGLADGASQAKVLAMTEEIAKPLLPPGYEFHFDGGRVRVQGDVQQPLVRAYSGRSGRLHGPRHAIQQLPPSNLRAAGAAVQPDGRIAGALGDE